MGSTRPATPFGEGVELHKFDKKSTTVPGQYRFSLDHDLQKFLVRDLCTPRLDKMSPWLWLLSTQNSANISALTEQKIKGRTVVITEDPDLHLTWHFDRVFVKPLPKYLLSRGFWDRYLIPQSSKEHSPSSQPIFRAATGFVRSYAYLIKHKSDFRIAKSINDPSLRLISKKIKYEDFCRFIESFAHISDSETGPRWQFGELRLSRLNKWSIVLLGQRSFMHISRQYADVVARYYGPLAFLFAFLSVSLSAMQVSVGVLASKPMPAASAMINASWGFSAFTLILVAVSVLLILLNITVLGTSEVIFAAKERIALRRGKKKTVSS